MEISSDTLATSLRKNVNTANEKLINSLSSVHYINGEDKRSLAKQLSKKALEIVNLAIDTAPEAKEFSAPINRSNQPIKGAIRKLITDSVALILGGGTAEDVSKIISKEAFFLVENKAEIFKFVDALCGWGSSVTKEINFFLETAHLNESVKKEQNEEAERSGLNKTEKLKYIS